MDVYDFDGTKRIVQKEVTDIRVSDKTDDALDITIGKINYCVYVGENPTQTMYSKAIHCAMQSAGLED